MIDVTKEFQGLLSDVGVSVVYSYPDNFSDLPVISYYELINKPEFIADNKALSQVNKFIVDIWGKNPKELGDIAAQVAENLEQTGYRCAYCMDIPRRTIDEVFHKSMKFEKELFIFLKSKG